MFCMRCRADKNNINMALLGANLLCGAAFMASGSSSVQVREITRVINILCPTVRRRMTLSRYCAQHFAQG